MSPFYYKYIDPIVDYLQPLPKILTDSVVLCTLGLFVIITIIWAFSFKQALDEDKE